MREDIAPIIFNINDHVLGFYLGRDLSPPSPVSHLGENWVDYGSWSLGGCNYVIYKGNQAIIYDTTTLPEVGQWVRDYLAKHKGIDHFIVVLSHWHLDHIAGNSIYKDCDIVASEITREVLIENKAAIESGALWGPPGIEVIYPNITYQDRLNLYLDDLKVELHNFNIHTKDTTLLYVPADKTLFCGDSLEDTVTYVIEPENIASHITELIRLKTVDIENIYPNHGNPAVINGGGYGKTFIDATIEYDVNLLLRFSEQGFLNLPIESLIPHALANGVVSVWDEYRTVHQLNLKTVAEYYLEKTIPAKILRGNK